MTDMSKIVGTVIVLMLATLAHSQDLPQQAAGILRTYCYACHGAEHNGDERYDVTDVAYLRAAGYSVPGNPLRSKIVRRLAAGTMPPEGSPRPSAAEIDILEAWIAAGAKSPSQPRHGETPDRYVLRHILADIRRGLAAEARNYRYFAFTNVPVDSLPTYHAALAKALNSLSLTANISWPTTIDDVGQVLRIDQRDYGWSDPQWQAVLDVYPYFEAPAYVRGDWFIANALAAPLYYDLLGLPRTERELERLLGIDTQANIRAARVARAGIQNSGVAFHNRVIERHATRFGAYWKTYDFASSNDRQNVLRFPLGPRGAGFDSQAFEPDGGEIIFTLPNGLHGYYVADARGNRINAAPTSIVADRQQVSGSLDVVPGVSCMACHTKGIQEKFEDVVRLGTRFDGAARSRLLSLYTEPDRMRAFVDYDQSRYLQALETATGDQAEPIRGVALKYHEPLSIDTAAVEVGARNVAEVATAIAVDQRLLDVGLLPLARGQKVLRKTWESDELGQSPAQRLADLLRN